ncbi:MAG: hypothetical protein ACTSVK_02965 [Promethearchaeota archaeon]
MNNLSKLIDLNENSKYIKVRVKVLEKNSERNVTLKKDKSIHRVATFLISDETSTFFLNAWDDDIDKIPIKETIIINNGYVNEFRGELFLNVGKFGTWTVADSKMTKVMSKSGQLKIKENIKNGYKKVENLLPTQRNINLIGKVIEISQIRKVKLKKNNSEHEVAEFLIADDTGCVILSLWDNLISKITGYNVIEIRGAYVSEYKGGIRLNISRNGTIKEYDEPTEFFFSEINVDNNLSLNEAYNI